MVNSSDLFSRFALPLSTQAYNELMEVQAMVQDVVTDPDQTDSRTFPWGSSKYTSAKFYWFMFAATPVDRGLQSIWKSKCLPKLRVFAWLLMMDRLNTKDLMQRKNWHVDGGTRCVLGNADVLETSEHLFFLCPFAKSCWEKIGVSWDCSLHVSQRFLMAKNSFTGPCFMEAVICAAWNIWKERNDCIFRNQAHSRARWRVRFQSDLLLHKYRVKSSLVQPLLDWVLDTFT